MATILQIQNLIKNYANVVAVDDISFSIEEGTCFGLLGPNGAGKTTTIEVIEGIAKATSGNILYKDEPIGQKFRQEAGIQFQSTALQDFLTVRETLELFARLYSDNFDFDKLIQICSLQDLIHRDNRKLSGGQRQRLLLAIALVNNPQIVFLDEPTTGLDPHARRNFWDLINSIKERNKTIVLTTHYMEEAFNLCDQIAIMDRGKIIALGAPQELLAAHYNDIILELPQSQFNVTMQDFPLPVYYRNGSVVIHTQDVDGTIRLLLNKGVSLTRLEIRSRTLEDLFLELTGKELRN